MKFRIILISLFIINLPLGLSSNNTSEFSTNTPIAEIPEKIKKFETELFNFDTEKERLQKLIVQYKKALNYVKREFTDLACAMYYLCNHAKYGINLSYEVSSVLSMITLNNAILFLSGEQNNIVNEIQNLQNTKQNITDTYQKLKNQIALLQKEYEARTKEKKGTNSKETHSLLYSKIKSIDELIHELEAEEYVGFLKNHINKLPQNKSLRFSHPCFGEKKIKGTRVQFITKPAAKVFAPESGVVLFFGKVDEDQILILQHDKKHKTILYGIANAFVKVGTYVHRNQIIGEMYDSIHNKIALEVQILQNGTEVNSGSFFKN